MYWTQEVFMKTMTKAHQCTLNTVYTQPLGFEITIGEFILTRDKGDSNTNGHLIKEMCVPKLRTKRQLPDSATAPNSEETNTRRILMYPLGPKTRSSSEDDRVVPCATSAYPSHQPE